MSNSVRPHRWQPTRLPRPWDSPGKNTGVGCHFPLQCVKVKSESEVAQSCSTLRDTMDGSLPGSSAHGIFQARVLEWGAIAFSFTACKGHSQNTTPSSTITWELMFVLHRPGTCASGTLGDLTGSTHLLRGRGRPSVHRITLLQKHPAGRIL